MGKKKKLKGRKMTNGLQFRSLQFGTNPPTVSSTAGGTDDVLSKFTPGQRQKPEHFGKRPVGSVTADNLVAIVKSLKERIDDQFPKLTRTDFWKNLPISEKEVFRMNLFRMLYGNGPTTLALKWFFQAQNAGKGDAAQ